MLLSLEYYYLYYKRRFNLMFLTEGVLIKILIKFIHNGIIIIINVYFIN